MAQDVVDARRRARRSDRPPVPHPRRRRWWARPVAAGQSRRPPACRRRSSPATAGSAARGRGRGHGAGPLAPIADGIDVTRAEIEYAVTHEGALDVADVLDRRTRIGLVAADAERCRAAVTEIVVAASA